MPRLPSYNSTTHRTTSQQRRRRSHHRRFRPRRRVDQLETSHASLCTLCISFHVHDFFIIAALRTYTPESLHTLVCLAKSLTPRLLPCTICSYTLPSLVRFQPYTFPTPPSLPSLLTHLWTHRNPDNFLMKDYLFNKHPYHNQALLGLLTAILRSPTTKHIDACAWFASIDLLYPSSLHDYLTPSTLRTLPTLEFLCWKAVLQPYLFRLWKYVYLHYTAPPLLSLHDYRIPSFSDSCFSLL